MGLLQRLSSNTIKQDFSTNDDNNIAKLDNGSPEKLYGLPDKFSNLSAGDIPDSAIKYGGRYINGNLVVSGSITSSKLEVGERAFISTVNFTTSYADECSWTSGVIQALSGTPIAVSSGTTGRLQAVTAPWTAVTGVLGLWHMDETSGTAVDNAEGDANWDGVATNATADSGGKFSYCRKFDGTGDYITIADYSEMDQTTFTWEGWFKTSATGANQYLISRSYTASSATARYFDLLVNSSDYLQAVVYGYDSGTTTYFPYILTSNKVVNDNTWHQFAISFDASTDTMKLIVDGIQNDIRSDCQFNPRASAQPIYFGKSDLASPGEFNGYLDEFRFSNVIVTYSAAAVRYIYQTAKYGSVLQVTTNKDTVSKPENVLLCIMTPQISGAGAQIEVIRNSGTTITGDKIKTGRIESPDGKTYYDLDGGRIVVNDGVWDRILIGKF